MAIDIRFIVNVIPGTLPAAARGLDMNGLLLTRSDLIPLGGDYNGLMQFPNAAAVGQYFGTLSDEYNFAQKYFTGTEIVTQRPRTIFIGAYNDTAQTAWIRGQTFVPVLSDFRTISDGVLSIPFSGTPVTTASMDFTAVTSFSEVASIVQAGIRAAASGQAEAETATVTFSSAFNAFIIRAGGTGEDGQTIGDGSGNIASAMRISESDVTIQSAGSTGSTAPQIMERIKSQTQNWASFTTLFKPTLEEKTQLGQWAQLYPNSFAFVASDDDENLRVPLNTNNDAYILRQLNLPISYFFGNYIYPAFAMGTLASVDYAGGNGDLGGIGTVITYAHRFQAGLPYTINDTTSAQALEDKRVNFYGNYALRNDGFQGLFPGCTLSTDWQWMDHYYNSIWFFSALETAAAFGLRYARRIPYNRIGTSYIASVYQPAIMQARRNGTIDVGLTLSETQQAIIIGEVGSVNSRVIQDLYNNGYWLDIRLPGAEARQARETTINRLYWTYAGSVHRLDLSALAIQ